MYKKYYDRKKANNIINKLNMTSINKVYIPLIADIMLRRQFEYGLSNEILDRDLNNFINNVEQIETQKHFENDLGSFNISKKKIILNYKLFKDEDNFEKIYLVLAHECEHAMSYEGEEGNKKNRIFEFVGDEEAFTEMTASRLSYNIKNEHCKGKILVSGDTSYKEITPFVDLIAAVYGVGVKDLLKAVIEGKNELNRITQEKTLEKEEGFKFSKFEAILLNITILHSSIYEEQDDKTKENIQDAIKSIHLCAAEVLLDRIKNIQINSIDEFRKDFEKIKLERKIVENVLELNYEREKINEEMSCNTSELKYKLNCIEAILENENIEDKLEIIRKIQSTFTEMECMNIMRNNNILVDEDKEPEISDDAIQQYNRNYSSDNMQWNNREIVKYIKKHSSIMKLTEFEKNFIEPKQNESNLKGKFIENIKKHFFEPFKNVLKKEKVLMLPTQTQDTTKDQSWNLANWNIDRNEFMKKNEKILEDYHSVKPNEIEPDECETEYETNDER